MSWHRTEFASEDGISEARVCQILSLLKLALEVQEIVLAADPFEVGDRGITEHCLRGLLSLPTAKQVGEVEEAMFRSGTASASCRPCSG